MSLRLHCNGENIEQAVWNDIENALVHLKEEAFFSLEIRPEPPQGPSEFEVESENGNYLPRMLVNGSEEPVRMFVNEDGREKDVVEVGGYDYDAMSVTQDFDLIVSMIKEFYETGDVKDERLR